MGSQDHREAAAKLSSFRCVVITVSDSRTVETDESGALIKQLLEGAGHEVAGYALLRNEPDQVRATVEEYLRRDDIHMIITSGGTGMSTRDRTIEAVMPLFDKTVPGFGEFFRRYSEAEIGTAALMTRATAGSAHGKLIVCLPGSKGGVRLGVEKLLLPEIKHLVWDINR